MSKFHSVITRRDFMKALGLTGAGIGTAGVVAPLFHDLDEFIASGYTEDKPWWVKQKEYGEPTTPIDWSKVSRYDTYNRAVRPMPDKINPLAFELTGGTDLPPLVVPLVKLVQRSLRPLEPVVCNPMRCAGVFDCSLSSILQSILLPR